MSERRAIEVLKECQELMASKGKDYNSFPQARYYENNGVEDIYVMMWHKIMRMRSLLDNTSDGPVFEGLQDSARDLINYTAFFVEYLEGKMDGQ